MQKSMLAIAAWMLAVAASAQEISATSQPAPVWIDCSSSIIWKTATTSAEGISIDWPDGAASAQLCADAHIGSAFVTNITDLTVKEVAFPLSLPTAEDGERVVDLTLSFFDSSSAEIASERRTARVGLVRGVAGSPFRCLPLGEVCAGKWIKAKDHCVIPVSEGMSGLAVDGEPIVATDAPGWAFANDMAVGLHTVSAMYGEEPVVAEIKTYAGIAVIVR